MSDLAKWAILVGAIVVVVGILLAFPFVAHIDASKFSAAITTIINIAGDGFVFARGLINNFLSPWARGVFSVLLYWILGKSVITFTLKVSVWAYHYIFK